MGKPKYKCSELITVSDFINFAAQKFENSDVYFGHGTDNAWDEAVYLILQVLKLPIDSDDSVLEKEVGLSDKEIIIQLIEARTKEHIPVPYLTNEAWFAGLPFYIDKRVLIPRSPISELIESHFVPWIDPGKVSRILDIGTGSGCIAIAAAYAFPDAKIDAVDIFDEALEVAAINCARHKIPFILLPSMPSSVTSSISSLGVSFVSSSVLTKVSSEKRIDLQINPDKDNTQKLLEPDKEARVRLIKSDLFKKLDSQVYDIIISNPPYVANEELKDLPQEYRHEPEAALFAGDEGDEIVARILKDAHKYLSDGGILIIEVGNSASVIAERYPYLPFVWLEFEHGESEVFLITKEQLLEFSLENQQVKVG